jgi:flagellar operon protein (TIGR03826 family)
MTLRLNVDNCPKCGAVFDKNLRNLCPACTSALNETVRKLDDYMWKHQRATTQQLHESTGVSLEQIYTFMKEDRLRTRLYPNLTYPCEKCGSGIRDAKICYRCANELKTAFHQEKRDELKRGIGFRIGQRLTN